jgi:hypothetical protein
MSIALTAVTGSAQTGLTSPTYTPTADTAPDSNGKQYAITALGGTQTGVNVHSVSNPFSMTFWRPKILRAIARLNSNGVLVGNPKNVYSVLTRKGVTPLAGQAPEVMVIETRISVPAGSESYDIINVRAALSAHIGALSQQSSGIGDLAKDAIL